MHVKKTINKSLIVLLAVFLATLTGLAIFSSLSRKDIAVRGYADLADAPFAPNDLYNLSGEWGIILNSFADPSRPAPSDETAMPVMVPGNWNSLQAPRGSATYVLTIDVPADSQDLMLYMPSVSTAYRLYINGEEKSSNGSISEGGEKTVPEFRYKLVETGRHLGELNLVIHVSNHQYSKGGIWNAPLLGTTESAQRHFRIRIFTETLISGGVFLVGIILITLFTVRREFKSYANLGLFCLIMSLRTIIVGEIPMTFFFPGFDWDLMIRLEYLTMTLGFIFLNSYFFNIYKGFYRKALFYILNSLAAAFTLLTIFSPVFFFTGQAQMIQLLLVAGMVHFFYLFIISGKSMKEENLILMTGISLMLVLVVVDILMANNLLMFLPVKINTSYGLIVLIFTNSLLLIKQAARTSAAMKELTNNLEGIVRKRTEELEEANRKLSEQAVTDLLTGVHNRHEFANVMRNEDARYRRSGKAYAALYMDLDNFKYINDNFGHPAGDLILKEFAQLLRTVVRDTDYLFRLGGDEFFVLMTEIRSGKDAVTLAERILYELKRKSSFLNELEDFVDKPVKIPEDKSFSLSIGISSTDYNKAVSLHSLPGQADMALLDAKFKGKSRYAVYSSDKS